MAVNEYDVLFQKKKGNDTHVFYPITCWDNVLDKELATQTTEGLMSKDDKKKIDIFANSNILINSNFRNKANVVIQRRQDIFTETGYTVDCWRTYNDPTVTVQSDGIIVSYTGNLLYANLFTQYIENPSAYAGKIVTASLLAESVTGSIAIGIHDGDSYGGNVLTSGGISKHTLTLKENPKEMRVYVINMAGTPCTVKISALKLEIGSISTIANEPPQNYGNELAKCQRYQYLNTSGASQFIRATSITANAIYFDMPTPVTLRTGVAIASYSVLEVKTLTGTTQTGFIFSAAHLNGSIRIAATKTAHGMTDAVLNAAAVLFDANL